MIKLLLLEGYNYTQSFTLDNVEFKLNFRYNNREGQYYVSLFDANNNSLLYGAKLVKDTLLFNRFRKEGFPLGDLVALSPYIDDKIHLDDFATSLELFYITGAELEDIRNA
jgi:hypothetical protein